MSKATKILLVIVAIIAIGAFVRLRHSGPISPANAEPIKIGVVYGFTGGADAWAEYGKKGVDLAVKEINSAGGVNGRSLEVIYEDSKTKPAVAVSAFQKLVDIDKVDVVVGDVW